MNKLESGYENFVANYEPLLVIGYELAYIYLTLFKSYSTVILKPFSNMAYT